MTYLKWKDTKIKAIQKEWDKLVSDSVADKITTTTDFFPIYNDILLKLVDSYEVATEWAKLQDKDVQFSIKAAITYTSNFHSYFENDDDYKKEVYITAQKLRLMTIIKDVFNNMNTAIGFLKNMLDKK